MRFITFCWVLLLFALILLWQNMAVNLCAAHKRSDSCNTWSIPHVVLTIVHHTNNNLCAVHENSSCAVHESWLACSPFRVTRVFWLETWQKLKNPRMFSARKCQLRCELYCICTIQLYVHICSYIKYSTCIYAHNKSYKQQSLLLYYMYVRMYI